MFINHLRTLLIAMAAAVLLYSCGNDPVPAQDSDIFEIAESDLRKNVEISGGTVSVPIETSLALSDWNATSDSKDWCKAAKGKYSVILTVGENTGADVRTATVSITSPVRDYTITVQQIGNGVIVLPDRPSATISSVGGIITLTVTANIEYSTVINDDWVTIRSQTGTDSQTKEFFLSVEPNTDDSPRTCIVSFENGNTGVVEAEFTITQAADTNGAALIPQATKITPTGYKASSYEQGRNLDKCLDGRLSTYYYSKFYDTDFPVTLEFMFASGTDIDYFVYYPKLNDAYGHWGAFDLYVTTEGAAEETKLASYYFHEQNVVRKQTLGTGLKGVSKIKFIIRNGALDHVTCAEMEFYKKSDDENLLNPMLTGIFTDTSCSKLRVGITDSQIDALPEYFAVLARSLKNGSYPASETEFRIREYEPYSIPEVWADKLMTKKYSNLDNPTGIYVESGSSVTLLVGDTHGQSVAVTCVGEDSSGPQPAYSGGSFLLSEGLNTITVQSEGMLFILYNTDLTSTQVKPIRIHIPPGSGLVNGFFDLEEHKTDERYSQLLAGSFYKYFMVKGRNLLFNFHRSKFLEYSPDKIVEVLTQWDQITDWQYELMGIGNVRPSQMNNHILVISPESSYMWSADYRIGIIYTSLDIVLQKEKMMEGQTIWGSVHEIGHVHQGAINWTGSTESSNNLFSNHAVHKLNGYCSRGSELSELATISVVQKNPWGLFGDGHQNENTDLHMRMYWQLWVYYHRCGYNTGFWPELFKLMRNNSKTVSVNPGPRQLLFARMASEAAGENLTDFFEIWGFFVPVDTTLPQTGANEYVITEEMIAETKAYMSQFPSPRHAFQYIEDRKNGDTGIGSYKVGDVGHYTQFRDNVKITKGVRYNLSGSRCTVTNGEEAVAFEVWNDGRMVFFSNFLSFSIPSEVTVDSATEIYAVQADGTRVVVVKL